MKNSGQLNFQYLDSDPLANEITELNKQAHKQSKTDFKPILYSRLAAYGITQDRIRRPAKQIDMETPVDISRKPVDTTDGFHQAISFELFDKIDASDTSNNQADKAYRSPDYRLDMKPFINKTRRLEPKQLKKIVILLILCIISASIGWFINDRLFSSNQSDTRPPAAPAINQSQSIDDAEWQRAKAQWECALKQYEANQKSNSVKNKEISCTN